PIMGIGSRKMLANTRQNRGPLPVMSSLRAPESRPLTLRSEISQGIARRRVGNLSVDQKKKSARQAFRTRSSTVAAAQGHCGDPRADQQAAAGPVDHLERARIGDQAAGTGGDQRVAEGVGEGEDE